MYNFDVEGEETPWYPFGGNTASITVMTNLGGVGVVAAMGVAEVVVTSSLRLVGVGWLEAAVTTSLRPVVVGWACYEGTRNQTVVLLHLDL